MHLGIQELILIFFIVLIIFGPKRIPEVARLLARAVREFRKATDELTRDVTEQERLEG